MKKLGTYLILRLAAIAGVGLAWLALCTGSLPLRPRDKTDGNFVAEVWLDWEICRGSTLYRQRFSSEVSALFFVKLYAAALDSVLPTHFASEDWQGRRISVAQGFDIRYGVRSLADFEQEQGVRAFFSPVMPGHAGAGGEHASAHPALHGSLSGFKI